MKKLFLLILMLPVISYAYSNENKVKEIDKLFDKYNKNTPGCAITIFKDGKCVFMKGYGSAYLETQSPIMPDTKFLIGSVTKQFTGACIAMLIVEKKVKMDDDIRKYIPEFPYYGDTVRISHLLYHTSGIKDYGITMLMKGIKLDDFYQDYDDLINLILNQSNVIFKPGEQFMYSNSNYTLLGEIIYRVTGQRIEQFANERIFKPLGMKDTHYWTSPKEIIINRAAGYQSLGNNEFELYQPLWIPYGSGNICSTANDLSKWCSFILEQYRNQTEFIKVFTQIGHTNNGHSTEYACGVNVSTYRGLKTFEHSGALLGYKSEIVMYPNQNFAIIVLGNVDNLKTYSPFLAELYLKDNFQTGESYKIPKPKKITVSLKDTISLSNATLSIYNNYYELGDGYVFEVKAVSEGLKVWESWDNKMYKLYPVSDSSFIDNTSVVKFDFYKINKGMADRLDVTFNGKTSTAVRMYYKKVDKSIILDICGLYFNKDIKTLYQFEEKSGDLYVRISDNVPVKAIVVNENLLSFGGFEAILKRDKTNKIYEMEITNQQFSRHNVFKKLTCNL